MSDKPRTFTCPACGFTSHNPNDAKHRYCVRCHRFFDDEPQSIEEWLLAMSMEADLATLTPEARLRVLYGLRERFPHRPK